MLIHFRLPKSIPGHLHKLPISQVARSADHYAIAWLKPLTHEDVFTYGSLRFHRPLRNSSVAKEIHRRLATLRD